MSRSTGRARVGASLLVPALAILTLSGCAVHHHYVATPPSRVVSLPPPAPHDGSVYHHHGVVLVYDVSWHGYALRDRPHHYYYGDHYYRWRAGRWYRAARPGGPWVVIGLAALPHGLDRHHSGIAQAPPRHARAAPRREAPGRPLHAAARHVQAPAQHVQVEPRDPRRREQRRELAPEREPRQRYARVEPPKRRQHPGRRDVRPRPADPPQQPEAKQRGRERRPGQLRHARPARSGSEAPAAGEADEDGASRSGRRRR